MHETDSIEAVLRCHQRTLCHFTVGDAVDGPRLATLATYGTPRTCAEHRGNALL